MKTWIDPEAVSIPANLQSAIGGHPLVTETLFRRGVTTLSAAQAFLDPDCYTPASPYDLPDMDKAVERLQRAIKAGESICVWGDFDVDGQTSTALLVSGLRGLGANVSYHIPLRRTEGHGVNVPVLSGLIDNGIDVLLTCDTGIVAYDAVDHATARGVDVIVTDHHQLGERLPDAYAVVNPQRVAPGHPLHTLPGVGCAYKLIEALYNAADRPAETDEFLDLVALGIMVDVAVQVGDARYLLQRGIEKLRETQRPGLRALMEVSKLVQGQLTEEHIAFMLGPRMNALGRLDDANMAVELLTTDSYEQARILSNVLETLNNDRKLLSAQVLQGAQAQIDRDRTLLEDHRVLVLANPHWHTGVVGIVASRLVELYDRPVILIANPDDGVAKGSARSVEGCDITAAISANSGYLLGFGGHTMAAGLSMEASKIDAFRRALSRTLDTQCGDLSEHTKLDISAYVNLMDINLYLVEQIERLAPFGAGNPPLVLATRNLRVKTFSNLGRTGDHRALTVVDGENNSERVLWWQGGDQPLPQGAFDLAFVARSSDYRGVREPQLEWVAFRQAEGVVVIGDETAIEAIDCRDEADPSAKLADLDLLEAPLQIWSEADTPPHGQPRRRDELIEHKALVIWTPPPDNATLQNVLEQVAPERVYIFKNAASTDQLDGFVKRLGGLVNYALKHKHGTATVSILAAASAQREVTVRAGLDWLTIQGQINWHEDDDGQLFLQRGDGQPRGDLSLATGALKALLEETAAYRRQFVNAVNPLG